eukprot:1608357-Rhodomonas_salina.1
MQESFKLKFKLTAEYRTKLFIQQARLFRHSVFVKVQESSREDCSNWELFMTLKPRLAITPRRSLARARWLR